MPSKTLSELYAELPHRAIAERAENKFRADQVNRRRLSERIAHYIPHAIIIVWLAAYALSAPHTATLFARITPDVQLANISLSWIAVNVAPLAVEGFVFILSGVRRYGKHSVSGLLFALIALSISVNVVGGTVILQEHGVTLNALMSLELDTNALWVLTAVFAGVLISLVSYVAGSLLVEFSTGELNLEIDTGEKWRGRRKYYSLREAFYNAALKHGATPSRASRYAETQALQFCDGEIDVREDGTVQSVSKSPVPVPASPVSVAADMSGAVRGVRVSANEMGFAAMQDRRVPELRLQGTRPIMDSADSPILRTRGRDALEDWLNTDPDWQRYATGSTKRSRARSLSTALWGSSSGYKTIERVFEKRGMHL